jgi:hypothetical protein
MKSNQVGIEALLLAGFVSQLRAVKANIKAFEERVSKKIFPWCVVDVV